jgi:phosphate transport system permease protein
MAQSTPRSSSWGSKKAQRELKERAIESVLFFAAFSAVGTTVAILYILLEESIRFFQQVPLWDFLTDTRWTPLFEDKHYGILSLLSGTFVTTVVALTVAIPLGTIIAIFLSEFAKPQAREVIKPILELLAAVPTVVYGYFALLAVTPVLQFIADSIVSKMPQSVQDVYPGISGFNMLSAGLVMGIMIIPLIASISEDAMRAVPVALREGSYAMGGTRFQTALRVVLPAAMSGISSAYILGISRAVGETMIVAIAAGLQPIMTLNPLDSAATVTAYIVQVCQGDLPFGSLEYSTIFAAGLTLVIGTLLLNIAGYFLNKRYRESY